MPSSLRAPPIRRWSDLSVAERAALPLGTRLRNDTSTPTIRPPDPPETWEKREQGWWPLSWRAPEYRSDDWLSRFRANLVEDNNPKRQARDEARHQAEEDAALLLGMMSPRDGVWTATLADVADALLAAEARGEARGVERAKVVECEGCDFCEAFTPKADVKPHPTDELDRALKLVQDVGAALDCRPGTDILEHARGVYRQAREAVRERAAMREVVEAARTAKAHGGHLPDCDRTHGVAGSPCSCGMSALHTALSALALATPETTS